MPQTKTDSMASSPHYLYEDSGAHPILGQSVNLDKLNLSIRLDNSRSIKVASDTIVRLNRNKASLSEWSQSIKPVKSGLKKNTNALTVIDLKRKLTGDLEKDRAQLATVRAP